MSLGFCSDYSHLVQQEILLWFCSDHVHSAVFFNIGVRVGIGPLLWGCMGCAVLDRAVWTGRHSFPFLLGMEPSL
jgi:hypothetical protein